MRIADILWLKEIIEKLAWKHGVTVDEVEEVIWNRPHFRFVTKGQRNHEEDLYVAHGQTYGQDATYPSFLFTKMTTLP